MKMNTEMSVLLEKAGIRWPFAENIVAQQTPGLEDAEGSVLLSGERDRNRHVKISDFPDKTGFECFLNHVHFPFEGTSESLVSCLSYTVALGKALTPFARNRCFRVIVAISEGDCTVRFHQIRSGEDWVSDNIEQYKSEAVLIFDVGS